MLFQFQFIVNVGGWRMNKENIFYIIAITILAIGGIGGIWYSKFQWDLCREAGLDFWYCIQHIG